MVEVDEGVNSSGALLVSCFPSVGFVSSIVAHFLVEKLELELVGGVRHPKLLPYVWFRRVSLCRQLDSMLVSQSVIWISVIRLS